MLAKKTWRIVAIRQIRQSFLPAKVLFYTVIVISTHKVCPQPAKKKINQTKETNKSFEKHIFCETHIWTACGDYVIFFDLLSKGGTDGDKKK